MKLLNKLNKKSIGVLVVVAAVVWLIVSLSKSGYENEQSVLTGSDGATMGSTSFDDTIVASELAQADEPSIAMSQAGVGLASALLPREMASQEDFGEFAPDDILKGQNFLDPRNHIGMPETVGGTLRNANLQLRADPPNQKQPYQWNNSTIVPDLMRRSAC